MAEREFRIIKEIAQSDSRGRISLGTQFKNQTYRILQSDRGQIVIEPCVVGSTAMSTACNWNDRRVDASASLTEAADSSSSLPEIVTLINTLV